MGREATGNDGSEANEGPVLSDILRVWGPVLVLTAIGLAVAWRFVGAPPPDSIRIATGVPGGGYAAAGEAFARSLEEAGIAVERVATAGATENLELLRAGDVDVALVQGGLAAPEEPGLAGVVSLYLEPLWIAASGDGSRLDHLAARSVEVGAEGSGTRALALRLFEAAGVEVDARGSEPAVALEAAESGDAAAVVRVAAPRSESARDLLASRVLTVCDLERAQGIARTLTFLRAVVVPAGAVDLAADLPAQDLRTVAPAANLVARDDLHAAVVALLVEAARAEYGGRGVLEDEGEFPTLALLDVPPSKAARYAVRNGPSFLYRVLPFQLAALVDRLKILLLPLVTLLLPLARVAPPLYRWRIRRRILTWYKRVIALEQKLREHDAPPEERMRAALELDRFDDELAAVKVPLGYADELFHLRLHLRMVREDLEVGRGRWAKGSPE